ncbi:MAG: membrane protein insertion efficiency factor YidD [Mastigocoleus sp.]
MKKIFIWLIKGYKIFISPLLPPSCRFQPTCSEYAMEAIERFGIFRGTWLGTKRILRCNPFFPGGYDPVPLLSMDKKNFSQVIKKDKDNRNKKED